MYNVRMFCRDTRFNIASCSNIMVNAISFPHSQHIAVGKAITVQPWTGSEFSSRLRLPEFLGIWHLKVANLTALRTGRLYLQEILLVLIPVWGSFKMRTILRTEKYNDPIGKRTCYLQPCSTVHRRMVGLQMFHTISYIYLYILVSCYTTGCFLKFFSMIQNFNIRIEKIAQLIGKMSIK
jgi:hypothetical protein